LNDCIYGNVRYTDSLFWDSVRSSFRWSWVEYTAH